MAKWTNTEDQPQESLGSDDHWTLYFDGSRELKGSGAGILLITPQCDQLQYVIQFLFSATNNMAEYEGLLARLRATKSLGVCRLLARGDSQLVVNQVSKEYSTSDEIMAQYLGEVRKLEKHFKDFEVQHIPRKE